MPKPRVVILCDESAYQHYPAETDLQRLRAYADVEWAKCRSVAVPADVVEGVTVVPKSASSGRGTVAIMGGNVGYGAAGELAVPSDHDPSYELVKLLDGKNPAVAVILAPNGPRLTEDIISQLTELKLVGDLEGDRFANRIDVGAAAAHGIAVVDTTQGTSYPVAEWALALALIALKNAGADFRRMIGGGMDNSGPSAPAPHGNLGRADLWGKSVGLVGCGFMGRRLLKLLEPFQTSIFVYDPYLPAEAADMLNFTQTSLDRVMEMDVVISLVPQTPKTDKLISAEMIELMKPGCAFVNVSRGAVVDTDALVKRLQRGDITAGLDVFDPEPVPSDHPITRLPNVFLSPHSASRTTGGGHAMFALMVDEVIRVLEGHQPQFKLTPATVANRNGLPPPSKL